MIAGAGPALGYLQDLRLAGSEGVIEGQGPIGRAIRSGEPWIMHDVRKEPELAPWRRKALAFGIRSSVTVPFSREGRVVGILKVYAADPTPSASAN
ncbi:MAG: GAF domain-containing protein [Caulobacteraceae bacterium]